MSDSSTNQDQAFYRKTFQEPEAAAAAGVEDSGTSHTSVLVFIL
jgi:hypothetical protein